MHDKICDLTASMIDRDRKLDSSIQKIPEFSLEQSYEALDKRVAALQRQIAEKHSEAEEKVVKMRQTLRREQAELIRISEAMNRERKRNFVLQLAMDKSPCLMTNCKARCSKNDERE